MYVCTDYHYFSFIVLGVMLLLFIISITGFFIMWFTEFYNDTMLSVIMFAYMFEYN